jgi:photosystem II stability/assembly factor-like uncharacterized protein
MKKLLLILVMASFTNINAQYQWLEQATGYPIAGTYTGDLSLVTSDVIWSLASRTAATNHQRISLTTDGGTTWISKGVTLASTTSLGIGNISATSASQAYISVFPLTGANAAAQGVYRTNNGGNSWAKVAGAAYTASSFVNLIHFFDVANGISMGDPLNGKFEMYRTSNAGIGWTAVPAANLPTPLMNQTPAPDTPEYGYTNKYTVKGNTIWIGTGNGRLLRSTDKGLNWTAITTPVLDFGGGINPTNTADATFRDDNNGIILRQNYSSDTPPVFIDYTLFRTTDGGTNWTDITDVNQIVYRSGVTYAGNTLYSSGSSMDNFGTSFSNDDGTTWNELSTGSHTHLEFLSESVGYSGGFASSSTAGGVFKLVPAAVNTNSFTSDKFTVSPNPVTDVLRISNTENINFTSIQVTDINGRIVKSLNLKNVTSSQINVADLNAGIYFLNITSDAGKAVKKFIKN